MKTSFLRILSGVSLRMLCIRNMVGCVSINMKSFHIECLCFDVQQRLSASSEVVSMEHDKVEILIVSKYYTCIQSFFISHKQCLMIRKPFQTVIICVTRYIFRTEKHIAWLWFNEVFLLRNSIIDSYKTHLKRARKHITTITMSNKMNPLTRMRTSCTSCE